MGGIVARLAHPRRAPRVTWSQTPFEQRPDGKPSDDPRLVHAGFFASARAVNRRLKELLVAACAGTPGEWEVGRTRRRSHAR